MPPGNGTRSEKVSFGANSAKPPHIPEISGDLDTSCFEDHPIVSDQKNVKKSHLPLTGTHLPFIGFSYSGDLNFSLTDAEVDRKSDVFKYNAELEQLKSTLQLKEKTINDLITQLETERKSTSNDLESVVGELVVENSRLTSKIESLETQVQIDLENIEKLENKLKADKVNEIELQNKNSELSSLITSLKNTAIDLEEEKNAALAKLNQTTEIYSLAKKNLQETTKRLKELSSNYDSLICEVENFQTTFSCTSVAELVELMNKTNSENILLKSKVGAYETAQLQVSSEDKTKKTNDDSELLKEKQTLQEDNNALKLANDDLKHRCQELTNRCEKLYQSTRDLTNENVTLGSKFSQISVKFSALSTTEGLLIKEKSELTSRVRVLENELENSHSLLRSIEKRFIELTEQLNFFEVRINTAFIKLDGARNDSLQREMIVKNLQETIGKLNEKNKLLQNEMDLQNSKFVELKQQLPTSDGKGGLTTEGKATEGGKSLEEYEQLLEQFNKLKKSSEKQISDERILKEQAIQKLHQYISDSKLGVGSIKPKSTSRPDRKMDQQCKLLQLDILNEKNKNAEITKAFEAQIAELNATIDELQHTIDTLNEELKLKNGGGNISNDANPATYNEFINLGVDQVIKQNFLLIPYKTAKLRKLNWNRVIGTLTNNTLTIRNSNDPPEAPPLHTIEIKHIFYVRPISQNDLIRAPAHDIAKIFQVIYSDESALQEAKPVETSDKSLLISNHCFVHVQYHMPTTCDVCGKGLWGFIKSSYAIECRNCHFRCHKDHALEPKIIPGCKDYDKKRMAKEILLMAQSENDQKHWIEILLNIMKQTATALPGNKAGTNFKIIYSKKDALKKASKSQESLTSK